ncbi:MAG: hypothetical protein AAF442_03365 [Pseudomonadota bacterium]
MGLSLRRCELPIKGLFAVLLLGVIALTDNSQADGHEHRRHVGSYGAWMTFEIIDTFEDRAVAWSARASARASAGEGKPDEESPWLEIYCRSFHEMGLRASFPGTFDPPRTASLQLDPGSAALSAVAGTAPRVTIPDIKIADNPTSLTVTFRIDREPIIKTRGQAPDLLATNPVQVRRVLAKMRPGREMRVRIQHKNAAYVLRVDLTGVTAASRWVAQECGARL